jgi:hypothetical protein
VLSFTNKAIEEFKLRSADMGVGRLLHYPGFIGTFDSFVCHYLFMPTGDEGSSGPHVVESWDSLGVEIRLQGRNAFPGPGVSLDRFHPETNAIDPNRITHAALRGHVTDHRSSYEGAARSYRQNLKRQGYFSTSDVRLLALQRIRREELGQALGRALAGRFQEIVVDEAQDCNPNDLEVLAWLRASGIRVTMVCDMDQSIFGFRDGERTHLEAFADTYLPENRLTLTGNFRSSPAICSLAASLRSGIDSDIPSGPAHEITVPIALYPYVGRKVSSHIGTWFVSHAEGEGIGIPRTELIILAHSERAARIAAGGSSAVAEGTSKIERLARAICEFWTGTTQHAKSSALSSIEELLLDLSGKRNGREPNSHMIRRLGLDVRLLRRQALELAMRLPKVCPAADVGRAAWIDCARRVVQELGIVLSPGQTVRAFLRNPGSPSWSRCLEPSATSCGLPYSTIHNAKGGEYKGVCVVVPPANAQSFTTQLFAAWVARSDHEPKRVIYVGVTRAMHLAALAIPAAFLLQCIAILESANVPYAAYGPCVNGVAN